MRRRPSTQTNVGSVDSFVGTAYDSVKVVADNIEAVKNLSANLAPYLAEYAAAPLIRPDGAPLESGDNYYDTGEDLLYVYTGTTWMAVSPENILGLTERAEAAAIAAEASESSASTSVINASTSEGNAATSEGNAGTSAGTASTKASEASGSASAASTSESNASASESSASTDATTAVTQAGIATTGASTATTKAGEASTSASNASTSEGNASTSETNAGVSEVNAAASAASINQLFISPVAPEVGDGVDGDTWWVVEV